MKKLKLRIVSFFLRIYSWLESFSVKRKRDLEKLRFFTDFEERDDDIYIVTFLKSGTTWMQMILHLMFSEGEPDFEHIYDVSPWLSNEAYKAKLAGRVNDLPSPRRFKSHDPYIRFSANMKGKIVYVHRDCHDTCVSLLHHLQAYKDPSKNLDDVIEEYFSPNKDYNWYSFQKNWLENNKDLEIFYVSYEDLKTKFDVVVKGLGVYLGVEINDEKLAYIKKYSSFEYMKNNEEKFGEQPTKIDNRKFNQFIRKGESGEGQKVLDDEQVELLSKQYNEIVKPLNKKVFNKNLNQLRKAASPKKA